jgi:hypothetical protein
MTRLFPAAVRKVTGIYCTALDETLWQGSAMAGYHQAHGSKELKDARKKTGEWLKKLRINAGITQLELARACGYEYVSFMSQIEAGKGRIPPEKYEIFAKSYKVSNVWFGRNYLHLTDPYMFEMLFGSNRELWGDETAFTPS